MTRRASGAIRARLRIEPLEDRAVPASYDPGRVLVTFADPGNDPGHLAELTSSPVAAGANILVCGSSVFAPGTAVAANLSALRRAAG